MMGVMFFLLLLVGFVVLMSGRGLNGGCCGSHGRHGTGGSDFKDPTDIARERYARGEISQDQFQEIQEQLRK